ncbi:TonB-dependent receptor [Arachidicoccus ginsenosidivorans]|uniref:TonB-dependent receptor n=2 Tax=Arachidicoccus ginsenosidivorans TaxID=496057 RepID=A0A5B8VM11_9BACT|nr:TonB-dependent receptor [Arachidicoccus ginsenosidivorans]
MTSILRKKYCRKLLFLICLCLMGNLLSAQGVDVFGLITNEKGDPLSGVSVQIKGTALGGTSNDKGFYKIKANSDAHLLFSFIGFVPKEVDLSKYKPNEQGSYNIPVSLILSTDSSLNEVVIVGFGTQKKASMVSSITSINPKELKGPTSNLTTMLAGRVAGMIAFQRSGEPGADNADFFIRGLGTFGTGKVNPLILIDGIESSATDMARLQPDDIATFSVLKDATAAAVYGARGANGVVLITTKSGLAGNTKYFFRSEVRSSSNTRNFRLTDNITYMKLANEAALTRNPNAVLPYTQSKIEHTAAGDNPLLYPNNNWIDQLIKKNTVNEAFNMSASGGSKKMKYYVAGTYNVDNGVLKVDGINNFNNNIKLQSYSLRSNVNIDLSSTTEGIIRVYGQFDDYTGPIGGGAATFNRAIWSNPVMFPAVYPASLSPYIKHPLFGGAVTGYGSTTLLTNPYAEMVKGYQVYKTSTMQPQLEIKQDLKFLLPGLNFRAMGYLQRYSYFQVSRSYNPFYYSAMVDPASGNILLNVLNDGGTNSVGTVGTEYLGYDEGDKTVNSKMYGEASFNYSHRFGEKHDVSGMLIYYLSNYETGNAGSVQSSLPQRNEGVSGRLTYGFDDRYLAEFDFGYNGSERFAKDSRFGFFPSVGIGYRISSEKFFAPLKDVINNLKLRATLGWVGNDQIGNINDRFFYLSNVNLDNGTYGSTFGSDFGYHRNGVSISRYANYDITWEKSRQINLGLDMSLLHSIDLVVDAYVQRRYNILQTRSYIGATMGLDAVPSANTGEAESKGIDISLNYNKNWGDWWSTLRGTFTYATSKVLKYDENTYPDNEAYLYRKGKSISQYFGYIAERLFVDDQEVANSPKQFGTYMGGDIKYRDMNGDGVISELDIVPIGYPTTPEIVYGFGGTVGYKSFDLSIYFQGVGRESFFINSQNISPFVINGGAQNGLLTAIADSHWSEEDRNSYALWPRLGSTFIENNNQPSTWWMRNGAFLRFKSLEMGYTIPESKTRKHVLKNLRVYLSATNLAVWSKFKLWDPEMGGNGLGYPVQIVVNGGIQFNL